MHNIINKLDQIDEWKPTIWEYTCFSNTHKEHTEMDCVLLVKTNVSNTPNPHHRPCALIAVHWNYKLIVQSKLWFPVFCSFKGKNQKQFSGKKKKSLGQKRNPNGNYKILDLNNQKQKHSTAYKNLHNKAEGVFRGKWITLNALI